MSPVPINIVVGGEAGQGLITIGQLLTKSLVRSGYGVVVTQDYQSRIRGGHNTFRIRTSPEAVAAPQESIDLLVALDPATVDLHQPDLSPRGIILIDEALPASEDCCRKIPFQSGSGRRRAQTASGAVGLGDRPGGQGPALPEGQCLQWPSRPGPAGSKHEIRNKHEGPKSK
jgi:2-oxoglutarate ferredoxin oxidoreductase subunit alpha